MTGFSSLGINRDDLDVGDEFTGFTGSLQGILKVPGLVASWGANHDPYVIEVAKQNLPALDYYEGDIQRSDITKFRPCAFFSASPACPKWTNSRGVVRDFDQSNQLFIPGMEGGPDEATVRSRLLMDEVHRYLNAMWISGQPVLAGVVENVVECRKWDQWRRYLGEFHKLHYKTKVIALNSMHAQPVRGLRAPQSRDRLFIAYWLEAIGRDPDWDKWLRPRAYCPTCDMYVQAMQVFKDPGNDMGRYKSQYVYRCPNSSCRSRILEPEVLGAEAAIDWTLPTQRLGDRDEPLKPKTMARIGTGVVNFAVPTLTPAGGTWRDRPTPVTDPMPTRTTRETDGVTIPPMLVPTEGRLGKEARPVTLPARTQTCRNETGLATIPAFVTTLRGGGSAKSPRLAEDPLTTVTASGNHHGLVTDSSTDLLVPYYSNGTARPASEPIGALSTRDRYALSRTPISFDPEAITRAVAEIERLDRLVQAIPEGPERDEGRIPLDAEAARHAESMHLDDAYFRMLEPPEIARAMAFDSGFIAHGSKRRQVRGYGNAVTPPVSEVLFSALAEAVTGVELERSL
jgi:DNA (cytosine-5)-methyltransferase 1